MEIEKVMEEVSEKITHEELEKLGFKEVAGNLRTLAIKKKKMAIAYEHYRFVRQEKINEFNAKLRKNTEKAGAYGYASWQTLTFTPVSNYTEVPPKHVLTKLAEAMERKCFDGFEIAHIVTEIKVPDPILFGRIEGCPDRFYIDQWDNDVKIEDILKDNEG